jgi:hypothetical protein
MQNIKLSRNPLSTAIRWAAILVGFGGIVLGSVCSINAAYSDSFAQQGTIDGLSKAISITPAKSDNYVKLAILVNDLDPSKAHWALTRAVELNRSDSASWIELGLLAERAGDLDAAERDLLWAAQVDLQYLPRWTLANFYLRRGDSGDFWKWAKAASEMISGGAASFFRLCGQMSEDGELIDRLNLSQPEIRSQYLDYLVQQNHIDLAPRAIGAVLNQKRPKDVPLLLGACDLLINAGLVEDAIRVWNGLIAAGNLSSTPVSSDKPISDFQGFREPAVWRGFNWRFQEVVGMSPSLEDDPPGLRLTFSGEQPETFEPLLRYLPVKGAALYALTIPYRTFGVGAHSGLRWSVFEQPGGALLARSDEVSSEQDAQVAIRFTPSPSCRLVKIALDYGRTPGTTRINGSLLVRGIEMHPAD